MEKENVFDVKELSKYLGAGISSIRKLIYERNIPFYKIGNKYFFRKVAIDTWVSNMEDNNLLVVKNENEMKRIR